MNGAEVGRAVLIINRSDSKCGVCGGNALPDQQTHETCPDWRETKPGCGVRWTHLSSYYVGMESVKGMRPDLIWIDPMSGSIYPVVPHSDTADASANASGSDDPGGAA